MEENQFIILISVLAAMFLANFLHVNNMVKSVKSLEKEMKDYHRLMKGRNR